MLNLEDLQNAFMYAMFYNPLTHFQFDSSSGYYGRFMFNNDPISFNATTIANKIVEQTNLDGLFDGEFSESNDLAEWSYLNARTAAQNSDSIYIDFANDDNYDDDRYLGEDLYIMINDPTSKPVHVPIGTGADDESFEILNVAAGNWTLKVVNAAGDVLNSKAVVSNDSGVSIGGDSDSVDLWVDGVKELRPVNVNIATPNYAKMMKRNQKIQLSFSVANHEQIVVECDDRNDFEAWVPTGDVNIYARTNTGTLVGETTLNVGYNKDTFTQAQSPMMLNASVESTSEAFVNTNREGVNVGTKTVSAANGDYLMVWFKNHGFADKWDEMGLYARAYNADGSPKGPEFVAVNATDMKIDSDMPMHLASEALFDVDMDANGNFIIVWSGYDDDFNVYFKTFDSSGTQLSPVPFPAHEELDGDQQFPSVAMRNNGDYVITWTDNYDYDADDGDTLNDGESNIRGNLFAASLTNENQEFMVSPESLSSDYNLLSRVDMNDAGEFVVTWLNGEIDYGPFDDGDVHLYARTFKNNAEPVLPNLLGDVDPKPEAYLSEDGSTSFIEDSGAMIVADLYTDEFFSQIGFDGSVFLAHEGMLLPFFNHDVAMDNDFDDANFVATWINVEDDEGDSPPHAPGVYARYYYEQTEVVGPETMPTYKTGTLKEVSDINGFWVTATQEKSYGHNFSMSPTISLTDREFVVSWGSVQSPYFIPPLDEDDINPYDYYHELFFSWAARRETNASVKARHYYRPSLNGLFWTQDPKIEQINTCPMPPVMLMLPGWDESSFDVSDLFENEGPEISELYHGIFFAYPKPGITLTSTGKSIAGWHNNDLFLDLLNAYSGDFGPDNSGEEDFYKSLEGTDISSRMMD